MSEPDELRRLVRDHHQRLTQAGRIPAIIQDSSDLDPSTNKVRVWREDIRRTQVVNSVIRTVDLPVWLELLPDKELAVFAIRIPAGSLVYGAALGVMAQPYIGDETAPHSISEIGITIARLSASTDGGFYVHTDAFDFGLQRHPGGSLNPVTGFDATTYDESVETLLPTTPLQACWALRYFDPSDATFHFATSTPRTVVTVDWLPESDLDTISVPVGCYRVGAVALAYGQMTVVGGRFASARDFLTPVLDERLPNLNSILDDVVIDYHGDVVADRHGTLVYSR